MRWDIGLRKYVCVFSFNCQIKNIFYQTNSFVYSWLTIRVAYSTEYSYFGNPIFWYLLPLNANKVEKIFKKIAWIRSHHLHPQGEFKLFEGKFTWGNRAKHCWDCWVVSTNFLFSKVCFAFKPQANFPAHNFNFHWSWRWWDRIQATF